MRILHRWSKESPSSKPKRITLTCSCGEVRDVLLNNYKAGKSSGCGGVRSWKSSRELHGLRNTREYGIWNDMRRRCHDPRRPAYSDYGGRGIQVCERWRNSFATFLEDMGRCPPNQELDRKDNDSGYTPSNCRWVTKKRNCRNRRSNLRLMHKGKTQTLVEWCEELDLPYNTIRRRIRVYDWPIAAALDTPIGVSRGA